MPFTGGGNPHFENLESQSNVTHYAGAIVRLAKNSSIFLCAILCAKSLERRFAATFSATQARIVRDNRSLRKMRRLGERPFALNKTCAATH
jgi:hypothetical protein